MSLATPLLARLRLESSGVARRLARAPLLGPLLRGVARRVLPRGTVVWAKIRSGDAAGLWILLDARSESDLLRGDREPAVQDALGKWLAPGKVFYDVGANAGFFSLVASRQVGPSGKIIAFEAEPDVASRLRNAVQRNRLTHLTVVEAAVWSESGTVTFDRGLGSPDRMVGHVVRQPEGAACISVPAITLDDFVRTAPPPDVVKCDVEGAESKVLQGAAKLFESVRPRLLCEVHDAENERFLRQWLQARGYSFRWLESKDGFPRHFSAEPMAASDPQAATRPASTGQLSS